MEPLAKRGSSGYRLANGDVLRMGAYQIVAALEQRQAETEETGAAAVPTSIHALRTLGRTATDRDIGAMLNLDELLVPVIDIEAALPVTAYGQAVNSGRVQALAHGTHTEGYADAEAADLALSATNGADAGSLAMRMARLAEAVGREPKNGGGALALEDVHTGLEAFCRGAGIDAEQLPADAQTRLLHLAGQLFREALVGFKDLERTRSETRNRYRIEAPPPDPDDPRPSLADSTVEELLVMLFVQHENRRLDSVQWLRETHRRGQAPRDRDCAGHARRFRRVSRSSGSGRARGALRARRTARQGALGRQGAVLGAVHDVLPQSHRDAGGSPAAHLRRSVRRHLPRSAEEEAGTVSGSADSWRRGWDSNPRAGFTRPSDFESAPL